MVAIPKIVLKSQTRMTLNERFTQYSEQQQARVQMLKNDLHTRITEDAIRRNGGAADTAELSRKLDNLQRVIESQLRRKSPSPPPARRAPKYSPEPAPLHRSYGRYSEAHGESMIVPEYRALLYHGGSGSSGGGIGGGGASGSGTGGNSGAPGTSWRDYSAAVQQQKQQQQQNARKSRYDLTYGDVIEGHRDYDAPSTSSLYSDTVNSRVPMFRRLDAPSSSQRRDHRDFRPGFRPRATGEHRSGSNGGGGGARGLSPSHSRYRGTYGANNGYSSRPRTGPTSVRTYADSRHPLSGREPPKRKYENPLMRDSSGSDDGKGLGRDVGGCDDDWEDQEVYSSAQRPSGSGGGIKSRLGVRSRLPFKSSSGGGGVGTFGASANGFARRGRGGGGRGRAFNQGGVGLGGGGRLQQQQQRSRSFSRPTARGGGNGGGVGRSRSQNRPLITKEDLDKELDEYHRKKGLDESAMQVDS